MKQYFRHFLLVHPVCGCMKLYYAESDKYESQSQKIYLSNGGRCSECYKKHTPDQRWSISKVNDRERILLERVRQRRAKRGESL